MSYKPLERLKISQKKIRESKFASLESLKSLANKFKNVIIEFYVEGDFSDFLFQLSSATIPLSDKKNLYVTINDSAKTDFMLAFQGNRITLGFNYNKLSPKILSELVTIFSKGSEGIESRIVKLLITKNISESDIACLNGLDSKRIPTQLLLTTDNIEEFCNLMSEDVAPMDAITLVTSGKSYLIYRNETIRVLEVFSDDVKSVLSAIKSWRNVPFLYLDVDKDTLEILKKLESTIRDGKIQISRDEGAIINVRIEYDNRSIEVKVREPFDTDKIVRIVRKLVETKSFGTVILEGDTLKVSINASRPIIISFNEFVR